jgi:broad-specificity NMP kinase
MKFQKSGAKLYIAEGTMVSLTGIYSLEQDSRGMLYLYEQDSFKLPEKIFGAKGYEERIIQKYRSQDKNLGVLLAGSKGSGKTLTSHKIAIDSGLPVVQILNPSVAHNDDFMNYLNQLPECIVLIDEFDKQFQHASDQIILLNVLDSKCTNKKLFILTANEPQLSEYLINRPSRLYYNIVFENLSDADVEEILNVHLDNKEFKEDFITVVKDLEDRNFDTVISCVKEVNLFGKPLSSLIDILNIKFVKYYVVTVIDNSGGEKVEYQLNVQPIIVKNRVCTVFIAPYQSIGDKTTLKTSEVVHLYSDTITEDYTYDGHSYEYKFKKV